MLQPKTYSDMEDSAAIMRCLTFVGGYLNAYCYFTRGGAFGTFHTGNLVRTGLAIVEMDMSRFLSAVIPILGAIIGGLLANALKFVVTDKLTYQRRVIVLQLLTFLFVGFLRSEATDNEVNFVVPMVSMFQLSSFRQVKGRGHNTTIMTGNLRTLTQLFFDMIAKRNSESREEFFAYFITFFSFVIGVISGGFISLAIGESAIWFCVFIMTTVLYISRKYGQAI